MSVKLKSLSFLLMVCVVFFHAHNMNTGSTGQHRGYSLFIQNFLGDGLTRIAVPLFFTISGYLFFLSIKGSATEFITKYKKRVRTLLIPYLFWSVWGLLVFFILQTIPQSKVFFNHGLIINYTTSQLLHTVFLDSLSYQLWFLKDLIVLIIISPVIYWLIGFFNVFFIIILATAWFYNLDFVIFLNESVLFFAIGAFISLKQNQLLTFRFKKQSLVLAFFWFVIVLIKTILSQLEMINLTTYFIIIKISVLFGVPAVWGLYDVLFTKKDLSKSKVYPLFSFTFFLYGFHEPLLTILKKGLLFALGKSELASLAAYFFTAILAISISILVGCCLSKITPRFYSVITGGR